MLSSKIHSLQFVRGAQLLGVRGWLFGLYDCLCVFGEENGGRVGGCFVLWYCVCGGGGWGWVVCLVKCLWLVYPCFRSLVCSFKLSLFKKHYFMFEQDQFISIYLFQLCVKRNHLKGYFLATRLRSYMNVQVSKAKLSCCLVICVFKILS